MALCDPAGGLNVTVTVLAASPGLTESDSGVTENIAASPPITEIDDTFSVTLPEFPTVNTMLLLVVARTFPKDRDGGDRVIDETPAPFPFRTTVAGLPTAV